VIAAILRWLPLSLALHAAALAATQLLPREAVPSPLFIDLTLVEPTTAPDRPKAAVPRRPSAPAVSRRATAVSPPSARAPVSGPPAPPAATTPMPDPAPPSSAAPAAPAAPAPVLPALPSPPPVEPHAEPPATLPQSAPPMWTTPPTGESSPSTAASSVSGSSESSAGGGTDGATPMDAVPLGRETGGASASGRGGGGDTVALGTAGDDGGVYAGYIALLRRRVQEALTYPSAARRRGMTGTVHVDISVEPTGRIAEAVVVRSSSHELLDRAALDAVRALRQVPFPPGVRPRAVRVRLPIVFELR